jgi:hypothetical protein
MLKHCATQSQFVAKKHIRRAWLKDVYLSPVCASVGKSKTHTATVFGWRSGSPLRFKHPKIDAALAAEVPDPSQSQAKPNYIDTPQQI